MVSSGAYSLSHSICVGKKKSAVRPRCNPSFIANLRDMVRVEAGALKLGTEATDLTDAVAAAVQDTRQTRWQGIVRATWQSGAQADRSER